MQVGLRVGLKPQAESLLFAAVLLLLQPIQTEVVDLVFQIVGLTISKWRFLVITCLTYFESAYCLMKVNESYGNEVVKLTIESILSNTDVFANTQKISY